MNPTYLVIGGNAYWLEPCGAGAETVLCTAPLAAGSGAVLWSDGYEVERAACPDYDAIVARLE